MAARLFVGNLPFTTTENDLQDYFAQAGAVTAVNIMQDRATGRSRGFAFIEMSSPENEARPREERPSGGRSGGAYRDRQ